MDDGVPETVHNKLFVCGGAGFYESQAVYC